MTETVTPLSETVSQIVRSRTCGCRDFYIAKITQNDATGYVAGTPVKLARAIKAKVDEKWTSEKIYSDDGTEEVINSYEGTEVELEVNALAPQDRQILFGQLYENGFLIKTADDKAPEVAVGWRERKLNGKYDFKWLYAGKFAEGISEEASTKEGKLSPTTKSIKGSFYERSLDNAYEISVDESNLVKENTKAEKLLNIVEVEQVEKEKSAFDEYDRENGYEDELEEPEENQWKVCGEIVDRVVKIAIRLLKNSYSQCMKENIVVAAIGPLSIGFGKVAKGISDTVTTGQKFASGAAKIIAKITAKTAATAAGTAADTAGTAATAAHTAATTAATATTGGMTAAQTALNAVMNLCPIILIVTLIAGLIAAGVALYKNWDTVKEKLSELWGNIKEKFNAIKETITGAFTKAKEAVTNKVKEIGDSIKNSTIGQAASKVFNGVKDTVHNVMSQRPKRQRKNWGT